MNNPMLLIVMGVALVIVMLMLMREYKAKNFKELAAKFDIKDSKTSSENEKNSETTKKQEKK